MSIFTPGDNRRLSVARFSRIPGFQNLPAIEPLPSSAGGSVASSSESQTSTLIARDEPCLITKSISYTHERAHWISAVRGNNSLKAEVERFIVQLGITSVEFDLDGPTNLVNLDRVVHKCLDSYAFIAVTGSRETLTGLIALIRENNNVRQQQFDEDGFDIGRSLNINRHPHFRNPQYELVVLHPEHFLPAENFLTVFNHQEGTYKTYVPAADRKLHESLDITSPLIPPFSGPNRPRARYLNPFLVILNAEIKIRRYLRQQHLHPPLPDDVQALMILTIELVDLLYWVPEVRKGTQGEIARNDLLALRRANLHRADRPDPASARGSGEGMAEDDDEDAPARQAQGQGLRYGGVNFPWPEGVDLETRVAIGSALISGRNLEFTSDDEAVLEELNGRVICFVDNLANNTSTTR